MKLNAILQKLTAVGLACGGLMLAIASLAKPAHAQLPESERVSKLRALQSSVLNRPTGAADPLDETGGNQVGSPEALPVEPSTVNPSSPPLPEASSQPIATATSVNGRLSVAIVNNTGTAVSYEVIGDTSRRTLLLNESAMLRDIPLPTTITVVRQDKGFVDVAATVSNDGMLEISLKSEPSLDNTQGVIRIQADGQVFVN